MERAILDIRRLHLSYGKAQILEGIDLRLQQGRIKALIGPNGAGKSSTMRVLSGLSIPSEGEAWMNDEKLKHLDDIRQECGFLIESPQFHEYLTAIENLSLMLRLSDTKDSADELLELVGLTPHKHKKFRQFSRGMKQRLGIAQALIGSPKFLIMDEPFHGLDPEVKKEFIQLFRSLADQGTGVLITSHLLSEIEHIADDFILLNKGKVYLQGQMSDYTGEKQHVKFLFDHPLQASISLPEAITKAEQQLEGYLTRKDSEELLKQLVEQDAVPYRIDRSSILYDKYMEISS